MLGSFIKLDATGTEENVTEWCKKMTKLAKTMSRDDLKGVAESLKVKLEEFKAYLPLISCICNPGMRSRHWQAISEVAGAFYTEEVEQGLFARHSGFFSCCERNATRHGAPQHF
jgi:hypothetical protein